eukprot:IDg5540t1
MVYLVLHVVLLCILVAFSSGMHVTVRGRFKCGLPLQYSRVALFQDRVDGPYKIATGQTDINGAYSLSGIIPESSYVVARPSANLYVAPLYEHVSRFRGTLLVVQHKSSSRPADSTVTRRDVAPGEIVDFRNTLLNSHMCWLYVNLFQRMSDIARNSGYPVPANVKVVSGAPVPGNKVRITVEDIQVPYGTVITYAGTATQTLDQYIRYNYDGSQRKLLENAQ